MSNQRIIFTNNQGIVSVIIPNMASELTIEEIAQKDVPSGKKYKIVDIAYLPSDRQQRDAWVDPSIETEGILNS